MSETEEMGSDERYARGMELIREIHGPENARMVEGLGDMGRYIAEFAFGDVYSRGTIPLRERQIATISMLTALGGREPQLRVHQRAALDAGMSARDLEELAIHAIPYVGFPAAINALVLLREVVADRDSLDSAG